MITPIPNKTLKNSVKIPMMGLGTWQLTGKACYDSVKTALSLGYTHIDTAEFYGNQKEIGEAIKGIKREGLFLTSKVWLANLKHDDLIHACKNTLIELKTEYLDLYLIHWPNRDIPIAETMQALKELHDSGMIRAVGVSNFTVNHLKDALSVTDMDICINQVEFHPGLYQEELLKFCESKGIALTAYSPIARGQVSGMEIIEEIAKKHGKSPAQISLRWLYQKGIISIPKASSEKHLKENLNIFDFQIDEEDMSRIGSLPEKRLINPGFSDFDY